MKYYKKKTVVKHFFKGKLKIAYTQSKFGTCNAVYVMVK